MGIRADMDRAVTQAAITVVNERTPAPIGWKLGASALRAFSAVTSGWVEEYQSLPIEITDEFPGWELVYAATPVEAP